MSITIVFKPGKIPNPELTSPLEIKKMAKIKGSVEDRALGFTLPRIDVNMNTVKVEFDTVKKKFRIAGGTVTLKVKQEVFIGNNLYNCAQKIMETHENKHVEDNMGTGNEMKRMMKIDEELKKTLLNSAWKKGDQAKVAAISKAIVERIEFIFATLTDELRSATDGGDVYEKQAILIKKECKGKWKRE